MKDNLTLEVLYNELLNIKNNLSSIENKIDELVTKKNMQREKNRISKVKPNPPTEEEISKFKEKFDVLFDLWLKGMELEVVQDLEKFSPEEIRRFADSNNLNVTSKMSKEKVLNLINLRFREKKTMTTNINVTKPLKETF